MEIVLVALSSLFSISSLAQHQLDTAGNQKEAKTQSIDQEKDWEPDFFETINRRANLSKLGNLRRAALQKDDIELRVWIGFGLIELEGFVIKKSHGHWSAMHLRCISPRLARRDYQRKLSVPRSGWEPLWKSLVEQGILTLPDSSELEGEVLAFDGESFVAEVNSGGSYRTYLYSNPHLQKWPEARKITEIVQRIFDEFGYQRKLLKAKD